MLLLFNQSRKTGSAGHYILGKTIGEGTFGKVKLGTHILTGEKAGQHQEGKWPAEKWVIIR